jgi:hypothetical protein
LFGDLAPWLAFGGLGVPDWLATIAPPPIAQHLVIAALFAIAGVAASGITALRGKPWVTSMARAADRRFRLDECMSTALEVASGSVRKGSGVVGDALLKSAEARTGTVDAQTRCRCAAALCLRRAAPDRHRGPADARPPPPIFEEAFGAVRTGGTFITGSDLTARRAPGHRRRLHAIAAILRQDEAARRPDLADHRRRPRSPRRPVETDPTADRGAIGNALERYLGLTGEAYARAGEAAGTARDLSRLLETALAEFDPARAAEAATNIGTEPPPPQATPGAEGMDMPFEAVVLHDEGGLDPAGDGAVPPGLTVNPNQLGIGEGPGNWAEAGEAPEYDMEEAYGPEGPGGRPAGDPAAGGGGEIVGAAEGAGDVAGLGGATLFGPGGEPLDPIAIAGQMLLQDRNRDGRRIQVNLPPLTQLMDVNGGGLTAGAWRNFMERQVTRAPLPAYDRDVVMRYFDAMMRERAE